MDYKISTSNNNLKNYEELSYRLTVIKDQYPVIIVRSDIDSVSRGPVNFAGQIRDDYGISHLQIILNIILTPISAEKELKVKNTSMI